MQRSLPQTPVSLLESWKAALTWVKGVGGVSGWVHDPTTQSEAELVDKVIANILDALTITRALPSLAGIDFRIEELLKSPVLRQDEANVQHGTDLLRMRLGEMHGLRPTMVQACAGLPLTLKVLGGFLNGKSAAIWTETLHKLRQAKDLPVDDNNKVFQRLRISYDGLDWEEQQMFLDVACLLLGRSAATAKRIWAGSGWSPHSGLFLLTSRCLLTVDEDGNLAMHDQLRDMGRAIEARGPGMRQDLPITDRKRLWLSDKEQMRLLKKAGGALPNLAGLDATAYASLRSDGYRAVLPECSWACGPKEQLSIVQSAQHAALPASHQVPTNT
ncbi:hypothetical protein WJX72_009051 [[Myrmecia] bisecta]|uniref:Disease resistance protein Roq1-like winged-helix domain-containing protein n=1 Tax=[Myrmecia] bisecta TaxID=41462 RepID=A0AAW1PPN0_9CHLO